MELKEIIENRRSVRKFLDKPVEREKINACLDAARLAPSACNSQVFGGAYHLSKWAAKAPVLVAVVSDKGSFISRLGGFFRRTEFYLVDQGISGEQFVLRAWDLGLGTCWIGWLNADKAAKFFNLPKGKQIEHLIALGYPAEKPSARARVTLQEMSSYNKYK